jgi:hypothetical protein
MGSGHDSKGFRDRRPEQPVRRDVRSRRGKGGMFRRLQVSHDPGRPILVIIRPT